jgi:hypothetical protein
MAGLDGEVGVINGMVDGSDVQVDNENVNGVAGGEGAAEGAAGLNANSGDGVDGEEPTGEVRQERVVVSKHADTVIIAAIAVAPRIPLTLKLCIFD